MSAKLAINMFAEMRILCPVKLGTATAQIFENSGIVVNSGWKNNQNKFELN
jgi:hypothetical protein